MKRRVTHQNDHNAVFLKQCAPAPPFMEIFIFSRTSLGRAHGGQLPPHRSLRNGLRQGLAQDALALANIASRFRGLRTPIEASLVSSDTFLHFDSGPVGPVLSLSSPP